MASTVASRTARLFGVIVVVLLLWLAGGVAPDLSRSPVAGALVPIGAVPVVPGDALGDEPPPPLSTDAVFIDGEAEVMRAGATTRLPLTHGEMLHAGDTLLTGSRDATVAFAGGSQVEAAPHAAVALGDQPGIIRQQQGRVFYSIAGHHLVILYQAPSEPVQIAFHGSRLYMEVERDGSWSVEVVEGRAAVTSGVRTAMLDAEMAVRLRPGEFLEPSVDREAALARLIAILGASVLVSIICGIVIWRRAK